VRVRVRVKVRVRVDLKEVAGTHGELRICGQRPRRDVGHRDRAQLLLPGGLVGVGVRFNLGG